MTGTPGQPRDRYISVEEASELIGLPKSTLYGWRSRGTGPRSFKLLGRVVYRLSDFDAWVAEQERSTSVGGAGGSDSDQRHLSP